MSRRIRLTLPATPTPALGWITAINVAVFFAWRAALSAGDTAANLMATVFTTSADLVFSGFVWTLLGSAASHIDTNHLLFNMLALWVFGRDVERVVGTRGFVHLYVAGGVMASLGHVLWTAVSGDPTPALGASGSVMAIAVVSARLFPDRLLLLFFILPMRQITAVGLFILFDLFGLIAPGDSMIAHAAHLGGAVYGALYYRYRLRHYLAEQIRAWRQNRGDPPSRWDHPVA